MRKKFISLLALSAAMLATAGCAGPQYRRRTAEGAMTIAIVKPQGPITTIVRTAGARRYSRTYSYNDDIYYRECRNSPDPAGVIAGALIGGLVGNAAGQGGGRAGATIAGVVVGGAVGAALTSNLDCEDRSYAYRTYYDGFNSGRPGSRYQWHNPRNDHRGEFRVGTYYNDPDGFRCADFTQTIYVQGRPQQARGRACRQPDGTWTIVG